jgi:glycosyltransferase involved in cell wall biosynthesis
MKDASNSISQGEQAGHVPKYSIIIPTFNRGRFIREAIDSALSQTYKDFEIIVADDGSTDDTMEVLALYGEKIKQVSSNRKGPGGARNAGARIARGEYLAFIDSDDKWAPDTLETVETVLGAHDCAMVWLTSHRSPVLDPWPSRSPLDVHIGSNAFEMNGELAGASTWGAVKKAMFDQAGGFVEDMPVSEDHELLFRLRNQGPIAHILQPKLLWYRVHTGQSTNSDPLRMQRGAEFIFSRWEQEYYGSKKDIPPSVSAAILRCVSYHMRAHSRPGGGVISAHFRMWYAAWSLGVLSTYDVARRLGSLVRNAILRR